MKALLGLTLLLLPLVGLIVFIRWDRRRMANQPAQGLAAIVNATAQGRTLSQLTAGFGAVTAALAFLSWTHPSPPDSGRRLRWLNQLLVDLLGPSGPAWALTIGSVMLLWMAIGIWRHTPKRPTDRWLS
jgi:hypothetical protein